jgi:hypothetical protein
MQQERKNIKIPTTALVKHFILREHSEPIRIKLQEHLGRIVLACVSIQTYKYKVLPLKFDEEIIVSIPRHIERLYKSYKVRHFSLFYQKYIYELFYVFVKAQIRLKQTDSQAIRNFFDYYEIPEDIWSLDSASRIWRRQKRLKKHTRFCPNQ